MQPSLLFYALVIRLFVNELHGDDKRNVKSFCSTYVPFRSKVNRLQKLTGIDVAIVIAAFLILSKYQTVL